MKVVVFGSAGFLGRSLVSALRERGDEVVEVRRADADVDDADSLARLDLTADVAINLAAKLPGGDTLREARAHLATNALGAANVAHWAVARGVKRLVHGSTLFVATRPWPVPLREDAPTAPSGPVTGYAASKLAGELIAAAITRQAGRSFAALRFSALYGPGMPWTGVLCAFIDGARAGKPLRATAGAHADFLHVRDAARATCAAAHSPAEGIFNVASGIETSLESLARLVTSAAGRDPGTVEVTPGAEARAVIDVRRLEHELRAAAREPLSAGVAELFAERR